MTPEIAGDPSAGDTADFSGDLLDGDHQRKTENKGPSKAVTELSAYLAVSSNAAWIVIGCAGDQTRSQQLQKSAKSGLRVRFVRGGLVHFARRRTARGR